MLLKNAKNVLLSWVFSSSTYYKRKDGTLSDYTSMSDVFTTVSTSKNKLGSYFVVGTGTTQETEQDYKLENEIETLTLDSFVVTNKMSNEDHMNDKIYYRAVVTNNTTENITVNEIGIESHQSSTYSEDKTILWYRKVIDPVTIAPNESYAFAIDLM